jgi:ribose transport system substrate-binding protein
MSQQLKRIVMVMVTLAAFGCLVAAAAASSTKAHSPKSSMRATASTSSAKTCGTSAPVGPSNPNGVYSSLSPALKAVYSSDPGTLTPSVWAKSKRVKGPWKIGLVEIAIINAYQKDLLDGVKAQFAKAKKAGLVTGSLITSIPATADATTPEAQIAGIQQMVRAGVNAIIVEPNSGTPLIPAIEAAGKAGIPVIISDIPLPQAKYGIDVWTQNQAAADAGTLKIINQKGGGGVLMVRGLAGNPNDDVLYDQAVADMKYCPKIHIASSIYGGWDNGTSKTETAQWLAAHPAGAAGVIQDGGMTAGVIQAYQADGKTVPPISEGECGAGDLSWWLAHKSSYQTVGGCINGFQAAYDDFNVALRTLAGNGPKYQTLELPTPTITNANLSTYAKPGLPVSSSAEVGGPINFWCSDKCLDSYFNKPGTPGGL